MSQNEASPGDLIQMDWTNTATITQTATPTVTASPTIIPTTPIGPTPITVTPSPVPWWYFCDDLCPNSSSLLRTLSEDHATPTPSAEIVDQMRRTLEIAELLYRVRDEIMNQTPEGQRLISLYYTYAPRVAELMLVNEGLSEQGLDTLNSFLPALEATVNGKGDTVIITRAQVEKLESFLDNVISNGDYKLQETIRAERNRHSLESMIGMTMNEAWAYLNGYQLAWVWQPPLSTANPYIVQIGSTIPVKFLLNDFQGYFTIDDTVKLQMVDSAGNIVVGPIYIGNNVTKDIIIQGEKYHYNLQTNVTVVQADEET